MNASIRIAVLGAAALAASCGVITAGEPWQSQPALVDFGGTDSVVFTVPSTVDRATPFEVSVRTYGGGCIRQGDTEVAMISPTTAEVRPSDLFYTGAGACTLELRLFTHRATLQFPNAGNALVRLRARGRAGATDTVVVRVKPVIVR
jgi:hypothetical protein